MKTTKSNVGLILEKYPETRASDKKLIFYYGQEFHGWGRLITFFDFMDLPSMESITRCRRRYQAQGMYLAPAEVEEEREKNIHDYLAVFTTHG